MSDFKKILGWLVVFPRKKDTGAKMPCQQLNSTDIDFLKRFLPENHETHVCKLQVKSESSFTATLRTRMTTEAEARQWLNDFEKKTFTTWRVNQTFPRKEKARNTFKICLHCHHNTKGRGIKNKYKTKNTSCKAILMICVKRVEQFSSNKKSRSKDVHFLDFPTRIVLRNDHNHSCEDSLPFRDVSKTTRDRLLVLAERGHNPYSMHERLLFDLRNEYGDDFEALSKDRALCPDIHYCYRLYYDVIKKKKDEILGQTNLEKILSEYNTTSGSLSASCTYIDSSTVVALCTPLMKRVNRLVRYSGELVFIDSIGDFEQFGCKLYLLLTHSNSVAGGLPLGVILLTHSESRATISVGLRMLTNILGDEGFFYRGNDGPQVFLTDDYEPLRSALCDTFPNSYSILCTFRFLQAIWKWLWSTENNIEVADRQHLLQVIKEIMYAPSVSGVIETYQNFALLSPVVNRYPLFREYLRSQVQRQHLWALAFRQHLLVRGYTTNSLSEAAFHLISQQCLRRTKMFHFHQMIDFIVAQLEQHFQRHLLEVAEGNCTHKPIPKFPMKKIHLVPREKVKQVSDTEFVIQGVENRSNFTVDTDLEMCSCAFAARHNSCKHLFSVFHHFNIYSLAHLSYTEMLPETKQLLYRISKGEENFAVDKPAIVADCENQNPESDPENISEIVSKSTESCNWELTSTNTQEDCNSNNESQPDNPSNDSEPVQNPELVNGERIIRNQKIGTNQSIEMRLRPVTTRLLEFVDSVQKRMRNDPDLMIPSVEHFLDAMASFNSNEKIAYAFCSVQMDSSVLDSSQNDAVVENESVIEQACRTTRESGTSPLTFTQKDNGPISTSIDVFQSAKVVYTPPSNVCLIGDKGTDESLGRVRDEPFRLSQEPFRIMGNPCDSVSELYNSDSVKLCAAAKRPRFEDGRYHQLPVDEIEPIIVPVHNSSTTMQPVHLPDANFVLEHTYSLNL